jgi:replication factor C large subunit
MDEMHVSRVAAEPWTEKYRPSRVNDIVGNRQSISKFLKWIDSWEEGETPKKKAALLYGPQGVGKTSLVQALAIERGYDLVEMNASDWRNAKKIERIAGRASLSSPLIKQKRIILLDEVDGVSGTRDRGGIPAIVKMQKQAKLPIVLTANDPWNPKFSTLRSRCVMIEFKPVGKREIVMLLTRISENERITANPEALDIIAERARGDARAAILDLQTISEGIEEVTIEEAASLSLRERKDSVFKTLRGIFNAKSILEAREAANSSEIKYDMLFEWIYENIPREYKDSNDLCRAMDALARANMIFSRIRKRQNWRLLPYAIETMTGGVALSREKTPGRWVSFQFPTRIRDMARSRRRRQISREIGEKIAKKCHCSVRSAVRVELPFIAVIFSNSTTEAVRVSRWLRLTEKEIEYISGDRSTAKKLYALTKT